MKLIIAGSRTLTNYSLLKERVDFMLSNTAMPIEIISGGAIGADKLGERYAKEKGYYVKMFLPDYEEYGIVAPLIRNTEMAKYATHAIIFWDGKSTGSDDMIKKCEPNGVVYKVVRF